MVGIGSNVRAEIALAFGVINSQGERAHTVVLILATGHSELVGADEPNLFRAALHLLAQCVQELGLYRGAQIDPGLLGWLLPVDRDYLLVYFNWLTFGDDRYQTVQCL